MGLSSDGKIESPNQPKEKFEIYFNPMCETHISWYASLKKYGYWPHEMYEYLSANGVEYPTHLDTINISVKIADAWVTYFKHLEAIRNILDMKEK